MSAPVLLAAVMAASAAPSRQVAITIDDLPGVGATDPVRLMQMNRRMLAALEAVEAPAIGFVNEGGLHVDGERDARVNILRAWLDAGMTLGNHGHRHKDLSKVPLLEYQDDVVKGEVVTRALLEARALPLVYYRHPYTHTGATAEVKASFERFLAERRYQVAPFTIEHSDWVFAAFYGQALDRGDAREARAIRAAYLQHFEAMCGFFEKLARELFGRDIAQVLLTHVNRLNADAFPELLASLRRRGYSFVTLTEALRDPAYATADLFVGKNGPSWLHRWTVARKLPMRLGEEPELPPAIRARQEARLQRLRSAPPPVTSPAATAVP